MWYNEIKKINGQQFSRIAEVRERAPKHAGDVDAWKGKDRSVHICDVKIKKESKDYFEGPQNTERGRDVPKMLDKLKDLRRY